MCVSALKVLSDSRGCWCASVLVKDHKRTLEGKSDVGWLVLFSVFSFLALKFCFYIMSGDIRALVCYTLRSRSIVLVG